MTDSGIYQLLLDLPAERELVIGALGLQRFGAGWYVYTGSARRNLSHRIARHRRREKRLHWHIDYLTLAAPVVAVRVYPLDRTECERHRAVLVLREASEPVKGFGSSDCRCRAHLAYVGLVAPAGWRSRLEGRGGVQW